MDKNSSFQYEIVQNIAILSTDARGWTKEINLISYNGALPKYDIRTWNPQHDKMGKGITLNKEELLQLKTVLQELL